MNHRHQRFDWDSERGSHTVVDVRKQITHAMLRALAVSIAVCGLALAGLLAIIGAN